MPWEPHAHIKPSKYTCSSYLLIQFRPGKVDFLQFIVSALSKRCAGKRSFFIISFGPVQVVTETIIWCPSRVQSIHLQYLLSTTELTIVCLVLYVHRTLHEWLYRATMDTTDITDQREWQLWLYTLLTRLLHKKHMINNEKWQIMNTVY